MTNHAAEDHELQPLKQIVKQVDEVIRADGRVTQEKLVVQLDSGHVVLHNTMEDFGYRKMCAKLLWWQLTFDLKERSWESALVYWKHWNPMVRCDGDVTYLCDH